MTIVLQLWVNEKKLVFFGLMIDRRLFDIRFFSLSKRRYECSKSVLSFSVGEFAEYNFASGIKFEILGFEFKMIQDKTLL